MRTSLYEKVFLDGFEKPSYVVVSLVFSGALPSADALEAAARSVLARHPRFGSLVRDTFGVPTHFERVSRGSAIVARAVRPKIHRDEDLARVEERLLSTPLDPRIALPFELHACTRPAALVLRAHHAVIDAASGFSLLRDFAAALGGREVVAREAVRERPVLARARAWLEGARVRPRLPEPSLFVRYDPQTSLEHEPVVYRERVVVGGFARSRAVARAHGATFSELLASSVLSAFHDMALALPTMPPRLGLMFARARARAAREGGVAFRADTCVVAVESLVLARAHDPTTLRELRSAARDAGHSDLALAALYATRKLRPRREAERATVRDLTFTLSDLTAFGGGVAAPLAAMGVRDVRILASPTSFDHAGMIASRIGSDLRLMVVSHAHACDAELLLSRTLAHLGES